MSKKRSDVFAETIVGIFMAAVLALLVYFTIVISGVDILVGHTKVPMKVEFTDVGGLKDRDSVMYRGMKVGVIEHIDLSKTNVVMTVRVTSDVVLREGYPRCWVAAIFFWRRERVSRCRWRRRSSGASRRRTGCGISDASRAAWAISCRMEASRASSPTSSRSPPS